MASLVWYPATKLMGGVLLPNVCNLWTSVKANAGCFAYVFVSLFAGLDLSHAVIFPFLC